MNTWLDSLKDQLDKTIWEQACAAEEEGQSASDFLMREKHLSARELINSLSLFYDCPAMLLNTYEPQEGAIARISEEVARRFTMMPLFILKDRIFMATADPGEVKVEDFVRQLTGLTMEVVASTPESIAQAINKYYLAAGRTSEKIRTITSLKLQTKEEEQPEIKTDIKIEDQEAPSIKMVNHIISSAIRLNASDIHLEPFEESAWLRYRIDGILREYSAPPIDMIKAVTSRIKIISNLDVAERRLPQDGRATFDVDGKDYDLRVSLIPNLFGESVVIRILASSAEVKELKNLGFSPPMFANYVRMITMPHGVLLVTGPTGSGKSTTLYATLRYIMSPEKKILTLEDPVECQVKGLTQFQMNSAIGFTFARALRSVLRHDPEVVLVGEIRDQETAEIAIRASLTGHMLFSTLHTNDAVSAPTRLIDMGVPAYLVMTSLIGVLAQRLVRRLCPACRQPMQIDENYMKIAGLVKIPEGATPFRPVGCSSCENLGYRGRAAVYELLEITTEMRRLPQEKLTADSLRDLAQQDGFANIRDCATEKWLSGITSIEEIMRLTVD